MDALLHACSWHSLQALPPPSSPESLTRNCLPACLPACPRACLQSFTSTLWPVLLPLLSLFIMRQFVLAVLLEASLRPFSAL